MTMPNNRTRRLMLALFMIIFCLFRYYIWHSTNIRNKENFEYSFSGIVEKVRYDEKLIPYVSINGKEYYLDAEYDF